VCAGCKSGGYRVKVQLEGEKEINRMDRIARIKEKALLLDRFSFILPILSILFDSIFLN
jgi:hypothetical protein